MGFKTAAFLGGAAQGLNVLGQGMLRQVERDAEQGIWEKRQALLAEIQRESAKNMRVDARDFSVAPATLAANDTVAQAAGKTARGVKLAELTDEPLNTAARNKMAGDSAATATAERAAKKAEAGDTELTAAVVARENEILKGTMGAKAKAAGMLARATDLGGDVRAKQAELLGMDIADKKRLGKLYDDYLAVANNGGLTDEQKAKALKPITNSIGAIKAKNGAGAQRDPELDTVTTKDTKINPDGTTTETTRKEIRRPGAGGKEESDPIKAAMDARRAAAAGPSQKTKGGAPTAAPAAPAADTFEQTQTPDGKTVYRARGTQQWYPSKSAAIAALGTGRQAVMADGLDQGF